MLATCHVLVEQTGQKVRENLSRKRNTKHTPTSESKHTHTYTNTRISSIIHYSLKIHVRHTQHKGESKDMAGLVGLWAPNLTCIP